MWLQQPLSFYTKWCAKEPFSMLYTLAEITQLTGGILRGRPNVSVRHLLTDSRSVAYPEVSIFFALEGSRHNGHDFLPELYRAGVCSFVVSELPPAKLYPEAAFILVPNTLRALQQWAGAHRQKFRIPIVGITGSNGKTIVKEWLFQACQFQKQIIRSPKSYNSQIGVPLSVLNLSEEHEMAIFEAGISLPGEMEVLEKIIQPDIGILTHLGEAHQEGFASLEAKCWEKLRLFDRSQVIIYCRDVPEVTNILEKSPQYSGKVLISWSEHQDAVVRITRKIMQEGTTTFVTSYLGREQAFSLPFADDASFENAQPVICLMLFLGIPAPIVAEKIKGLTPVAMRLEIKQGRNHCTLINDSYNSDTGALAIALNLLNQQHQHAKKTLILSDILQSGKQQADLYREVSRLIHEKNVDRLVGIGPDIIKQSNLFQCEKVFFRDTTSMLADKTLQFHNEAILIKGSRTFSFERIVWALEEKVHQTVLEINLNALIDNYNYFKALVRPRTKIVAMVKALSYGSGSYEIANVLQYHRVDYLAVAIADEGKDLRDNGINVPIIVMNPEAHSFGTLLEYHLEPELYSLSSLYSFGEAVQHSGKTQYPVHLKIDTGMHRLGFMEPELPQVTQYLNQQPAIKVQSVFSHLSGSDEAQFDEFTHQQIDNFKRMSQYISQGIGYDVLRHILNSSGIERFPDAQFDMVRVGIGLHGISALPGNILSTVATLRTIILQIKDIDAGESVGYSRKHLAKANIRIGILPIGYADGLRRGWGNEMGWVMIQGQKVPVIGNICMDSCMVDLSKCSAKEGDEVIIFGQELSVSEMARKLQTIPYEILTGISPRVKRVYYQE